jgi:hypothetical protein
MLINVFSQLKIRIDNKVPNLKIRTKNIEKSINQNKNFGIFKISNYLLEIHEI